MKTPSLFFLCILHLYAQQRSPVQFEHISIDDGLSQSTVTSIAQDAKGFIWYGTEDGLNKYDGYTFTVYRHVSGDSLSLSHSYISALYYSQRAKTLWVGTQNGVLHSFDAASGVFTRYNDKQNDQQTRGTSAILTIAEDSSGNIWYGTHEALTLFDPSTAQFKNLSARTRTDSTVQIGRITRVMVDSKERILVGANGFVSVFDPADKKFTHIRFPKIPDLSNTHGDAFLEEKDGTLWVSSNLGLHTVDIGKKRMKHHVLHFKNALPSDGSQPTIMTLAKDSSGMMWAGSFAGVLRIDVKSKTVEQFIHDPKNEKSLSENSARCIVVDKSGVVHIGTYLGVNTHAPWQIKFSSFRSEAGDSATLIWNNVRSFAEDVRGNIWIGTMRGLSRFNPSDQTFTRHLLTDDPGENIFWALHWQPFRENKDILTAGLNGGGVKDVAVTYGSPPIVRHIRQRIGGKSVHTMLTDSAGLLWVGQMPDGIIVYDRSGKVVAELKSDSLHPNILPNNTVISLAEGVDGIIWAGTDNGLVRIQKRTWTTKHYLHDPHSENSPSGNNILCLYHDGDGILWFGTYSGLNRFDPRTETFTHYTMRDGLPNDVIYAILPDKRRNLWLSTNKGIVRFNKNTGGIKSYTRSDGLQSNEFNQRAALVTRSGEMLFGGVNGFTMFHPDRIIDNRNIPSVVLTDVKVFNKSLHASVNETRLRKNISEAEEVRLEYSDAVVTFEFAALEYTNPDKNQYAYTLDGFNDDWMYSGTKREATFTNLDPGEYLFRVKASNNDGVWNEKGTSIRIFISPPWWATWWFRGIMVVMFLSIGPVIYFRRVSALKKDFTLQQEFSRRLIESQENERKRIAAELHDGLGQDLLVVKNRSFMALQQKKINLKVKEQLGHIQTTATEALTNVRRISRNLRPYHLEKMGLNEAVKFMIDGLKDTTQTNFVLDLEDIPGSFSKDQEVNVFRIIQEAVNNIVKHSHATLAIIQTHREERKIVVTIRDNGRGFSKVKTESVKKGFGLSGIGERVRILEAVYSIDSTPGAGTTVTVEIPVSA